MMRLRFGWAAALGWVLLAVAGRAWALGAEEARARAEVDLQSVQADLPKVRTAAARGRAGDYTPEKRVADAELLLRTKDYGRAIHLCSQVIELYDQHRASASAHVDARFLLGEAYFEDQQFLSARRQFRYVLDHAGDPAFAQYLGRSLSRLVDTSLHTNDPATLDEVTAYLAQLPANDATGSLSYARGKALFAKGDFASSKGALGTLASSSPYRHQAQYLLGVVLTKEAAVRAKADAATATPPAAAAQQPGAPAAPPAPRYAEAIEQFRKVTRLPAANPEQRHVVDLAWMAIGRLCYETDRYLDAAEAYSHVDRASPEFSTMLYELAWVYVRLGDHQRAQRALEVLTITDPQTLELADGTLMRADLLLKSGQFEKALNLYKSVRNRFDPLRQQVDGFLASTTDPAIYYDRLVEEGAATAGGALPAMVVDWARREAEDQQVFSVIDDVTRSRDLLKKSRTMAGKLSAVLASSTRVKAFPEIRASLQVAVGLLNRLGMARRTLALGMDDVGGKVSGELGDVRRERRALMRRTASLPVTEADFEGRDVAGEQQWNGLSRELQRLTVEADKLQAVVNGLRRVLQDADQFGVVRDTASRQRFAAEVEANERDLAGYRKRIGEYQQAVEQGKVQIGFGDQRYVEDDQVRAKFAELFAREVRLVAAGQDRESAVGYARAIQPLLARIQEVESQLGPMRAELERKAGDLAQAMRNQVAQELAALEGYAAKLDTLDQEARLLVGEVAMKNFGLVRDRLKSIVLRADVGVVQEAWEVREENRIRVRNLLRERAREDRSLNDELREVLDDAEESK
jgi:tetratricopeptide (TPR) repeat protein